MIQLKDFTFYARGKKTINKRAKISIKNLVDKIWEGECKPSRLPNTDLSRKPQIHK